MQQTPPILGGGEATAVASPAYRDAELRSLIKELRAAVKPYPQAKQALERVEKRLRYILRIVEGWETYWTDKAELLMRLGQIAAANGAVMMIFDQDTRRRLLSRCLIGGDDQANERMADAAALDREVLV